MTDGLPPAATAAYLTDVLQRTGVLGDATVREVTVESARSTIMSRITRLRLSYDGATDGAPESLFLKTRLPERARNHYAGGRRKVAFYAIVAPQMNAGLVPRCFDAQWDAETDDWHLLLEDLTDTHVPPQHLALAAEPCAMRADHRRAGALSCRLEGRCAAGCLGGDAARRRRAGSAGAGSARPLQKLRGRAAARAARYLRTAVRRGTAPVRALSLVHGDAHVWNCFLPRHGGGDVRLFDWDGWRVGIASTDLAYMMAVHWYPDRRRRCERTLLDHYHAMLLAEGVRDYDRRALSEDYQWAVLWQITTPVWQAAFNVPPVVWWNNMERVLLAVDDLGCRDLLV
jgi:hypothetical protein